MDDCRNYTELKLYNCLLQYLCIADNHWKIYMILCIYPHLQKCDEIIQLVRQF